MTNSERAISSTRRDGEVALRVEREDEQESVESTSEECMEVGSRPEALTEVEEVRASDEALRADAGAEGGVVVGVREEGEELVDIIRATVLSTAEC